MMKNGSVERVKKSLKADFLGGLCGFARELNKRGHGNVGIRYCP